MSSEPHPSVVHQSCSILSTGVIQPWERCVRKARTYSVAKPIPFCKIARPAKWPKIVERCLAALGEWQDMVNVSISFLKILTTMADDALQVAVHQRRGVDDL